MRQRNHARKALRIAITALLLIASLFRGIWAAELAQHDIAPLVDPEEIAIAHGHYHAPKLDHLHDESSGLSDDEHPLCILYLHWIIILF